MTDDEMARLMALLAVPSISAMPQHADDMKTAAAIRERTQGTPAGRMVSMLIDQILELMPELADVAPWHTVGQRRTLDDLGRTARCTISDDVFRSSSQD